MRAGGEQGSVGAVRRNLEVRLLRGEWVAGARLPAERALAEALGVSRATLREAVSGLVARGLLVTRRGSGVFVTDRLQAGLASPWRQLVADHAELRWDTLEFRRELEVAAAGFAAQRASVADLELLGAIVARLVAACEAGDRRAEAVADADFHEAIAEASHNSMFRHLHAGIIRLLREHIALNLDGIRDPAGAVTACLMAQHLAIWRAIRDRQPEAARQAMRAHIDYTWGELVRREADGGLPSVG